MIVSSNHTDLDLRTIRWQIGREEIYLGGIIERCFYGYPRIMLLDPIGGASGINYESLSNLMWLTCPYLNDIIHKIENSGYIARITEFINNDASLKERMNDAHAHFYYFRKSLFAQFLKSGYPDGKLDVFNSGIGGIRDINSLKCLHIHFCHYRIYGENIAGEITNRLIGEKINCDEEICKDAHKS